MNLFVGPLHKSITQGQANSESNIAWKFRDIAWDNRILTDPVLGLLRPVISLKSDELLHPFFVRDTADSQVDVLSRWEHWRSDISYFEWFWKESNNVFFIEQLRKQYTANDNHSFASLYDRTFEANPNKLHIL